MIQHLLDVGLSAFVASALGDHLPVLLFSAGVLAAGWAFRWPAGHLPLPLLAWVWGMTGALQSLEFNLEPETSADIVVVHLLEGAVALVVVLVLVGGAAAAQRPSMPDRFAALSWVAALVAVATALLDALFVMLLVL